MSKVEMEKAIHLQIWKVFDIWSGNRFAIWIGQIQLKLHYELVNYELVSQVSKLQLHKLVAIEFPPQMAKSFLDQMSKKTHLQMSIFCHFDFLHDRRNGFIL